MGVILTTVDTEYDREQERLTSRRLMAESDRRTQQGRRQAELTLTAAWIAAAEHLTPVEILEVVIRACERQGWHRRGRLLGSIVGDWEDDDQE
jgi:hypothetical protein